MICATLKDAKATLNKLVNQAVAGEDVVLMKGSKHIAAIVPISEDDIEFSSRISDPQAARLWARLDEEIKSGVTAALESPEDILK